MGAKRTFIYRIEMGCYPNVKEIAFCYARNGTVALDNMKIIFKDRRYDMFKAYKLGEQDLVRHPGPFEVVPKDEDAYLRKIRSTVGEEYAERRCSIPGISENSGLDRECGASVPGENKEYISSKGERISDSDE